MNTASAFPAILEGDIGGAVVQTVNARDLHVALGVGKDFSTWIKDRISAFGFNENSDFVCSPTLGSEGRGGHNRLDYHLTLDMAKELAMVERNEAGKKVRAYFIECERKLRDRPAPAIDVRDIGQLSKIAIQLIEVNRELVDRAEGAERQVEEMKPAVAAHDRLIEAHGSFCVTDGAKNLQVPRNVLFRWLRENNWIYKRVGTSHDVAYQSKLAAGYLIHKVETYEKADGTEGMRTQVRITPRGMTVLAKAFPPAAAAA